MTAAKPRPENGPALLHAHLEEAAKKEFAWGSNDCVHFSSEWLKKLGYEEPLTGLPRWSGALSAARAIKSRGGFVEAVSARMAELGCPVVDRRSAQRGDLAIIRHPSGLHALGIVMADKVVCLAPEGTSRIPVNHIISVWRT